MIFDTKQYVPLIYRSSRDFEALCRLLDMILTSTKYEIDTLINLYIPAKCPEDFLPLLAEHLGYKYNYNDKVIENRIIIDNFHKMIRNKGSETGIKLACALSLNSLDEYDIQSNLFDDIRNTFLSSKCLKDIPCNNIFILAKLYVVDLLSCP
jgi:phage tail-like protein